MLAVKATRLFFEILCMKRYINIPDKYRVKAKYIFVLVIKLTPRKWRKQIK